MISGGDAESDDDLIPNEMEKLKGLQKSRELYNKSRSPATVTFS
jgi:hypothetical protein